MLLESLANRRAAKLSAIFLSISAISLAFSPAAKQYEISLYSSTPLLLWISLAVSLLLIISTIFIANKTSQLITSAGLLLVFYTILYSIPAARGYHLYGRGNSDILTHIGYAKDVNEILTWYPAIHIQMRFLREWGLQWDLVATALAVVFSFLFAFGVALYARSLFHEKHIWMMTLIVSVMPLLGPFTRTTHPAVYSFMLLPIALWLARRGKQGAKQRHLISTLIISSVIIIFHPVTAVLLVIGLIIDNIRIQPTIRNRGIFIPVYVIVGTAFWYIGFSRFAVIIGAVATPNIGGAGAAPTTAILNPAFTPLDIIQRGIEIYGAIAIIGTLGGIGTVTLIRENFRGREEPSDGVLIGHYLTSGIFGALFLLIDLVVSAPIRAARYGVFASILTLPNIIRPLSGQKRAIVSAVIVVFLIMSLALSIGTVYEPNKHFTDTEYEGATWQASYHSGSTAVYAHDMGKKVDFYLFGANTNRIVFASRPMPDQLGYSDSEITSDSVGSGYLITKTYDVRFADIFMEGIRSQRMVYSEDNIERLSADPSADSIYSNGGYSVWIV